MAITLDGTNGILSPDFEPSGSTTPTNGLFLPTTNSLGFATNSTERLRLDASGNLGLGVTPSAWGSGWSAMQIGGNGSLFADKTAGAGKLCAVTQNAYHNGTNNIYISSDSASRYRQGSGIHIWEIAPSGTAGNAISFTQAMTLDASGNLGIGTSSPLTALTLGAGGVATYYRSDNARYGQIYANNNGFNVVSSANNDYLYLTAAGTGSGVIFSTVNTERARIDSSGNLLVGATSSFGAGVQCKSTSALLQPFTAWNAVDSGQAYLFYGGTGSASFTARYQIYWNFTGGTGTAGFLSDYRQKDNVRRLTNGLDAIKALKPSIYRFKDALEDASGFIAHEVQEVIPQAVSGHKDEVDEDGNPKYQMLDQTHIIPYLTAAIQELTARLEALEAK